MKRHLIPAKVRLALIVPVALLSNGCGVAPGGSAQSPEVYEHVGDRLRAKLRMPRIFGWPCEHRDDRECYRFEEPRRMHGLWGRGPEASDFVDSAHVPATYDEAVKNRISLQVDMSILPPNCCSEDYYEIDFIGRRTSHPGLYAGNSKHLVIIDKVISIRPVNGPEWVAQRITSSSAKVRTSR